MNYQLNQHLLGAIFSYFISLFKTFTSNLMNILYLMEHKSGTSHMEKYDLVDFRGAQTNPTPGVIMYIFLICQQEAKKKIFQIIRIHMVHILALICPMVACILIWPHFCKVLLKPFYNEPIKHILFYLKGSKLALNVEWFSGLHTI